MSDPVDQEIEAIKHVLQALTPLSQKARLSVLEYVGKRLDLTVPENLRTPGRSEPREEPPKEPPVGRAEPHIKDLKEQKKPRSANEMAALVAYYLANEAPQRERKQTINQKDVETYFKIAKFPLPEQIRFTLINAKNAGYLDAAGDGEYRLNAVGHNLVVHSMPRGKGVSVKEDHPPKGREGEKS